MRGKSSNLPFLPGGLEPDSLALELAGEEEEEEEEVVGWRMRAPGLKRGLVFDKKGKGRAEGEDGEEDGEEEDEEEEDDWVIEAFLGRGKGDEVRRLKDELEVSWSSGLEARRVGETR